MLFRPNAQNGLWLMMMCQCRFINYNKCPTLERDADAGGGCACVRQGVYGAALCASHTILL